MPSPRRWQCLCRLRRRRARRTGWRGRTQLPGRGGAGTLACHSLAGSAAYAALLPMFVPTLDAGAAFIPANDCPHCLASIASPALRAVVTQTAEDAAPADLLVSGQPDWLSLCPHGAVTGRILMMRDDYGTRFAVLA